MIGWVVLLLALQEKPVDPPKISYEDSGEFRLLAKDLEFKFGGRIRFGSGVSSKDVSVSLKDAGFYEVLDALCRAHGDVAYFLEAERWHGSERQLTVTGGVWVEHPAVYSGHFKIALTSMMKTARIAPEGSGGRVDAELIVFAPPWLSVGWDAGSQTEWKIEEARDADGKSLLTGPKNWNAERLRLMGPDRSGNLSSHTEELADFDLDRGLKTLAGTVKLTVADLRPAKLDFKEGATADTPQGKVTISSVKEVEGGRNGSAWIAVLEFKPTDSSKTPSLDRLFGRRVRYDGDRYGSGARIEIPWKGMTMEVETSPTKTAPAWIELNVRVGERTYDVPFKLADVVLKGK